MTPSISSNEEQKSIWAHLYNTDFRQGWVDVNGIRTRYVQAGHPGAPCVVMLHGTGGSWETFCANLPAFSKHFNCFALDMVGCGFSDKPDYPYEIATYMTHVLGFMDAMQISKTHLVGVSLGAWVAARLAHNHAGRIGRLALTSVAGLIADPATMARIRAGRGKAVEDPSWSNVKAIFEKLILNEKYRLDDFVAIRQASYRLPDMKRAMDHILVLQDPEIRTRNLLTEDEWREIQNPALLIGSVDDPDTYLETARKVAKLMPHARYVEMQNVGHWAHYEDAGTFNKLAIPFFQE
ncbi:MULTISPECIES: alpha/beta fold hydrolase [Polaromonas]|uniref:Alpha/beta fold hydrolase n=1 Tax=Polaromonas aquatica TaxID=332657 RepID=A0ABW1U4T3_9BURK